MSIIITGLNMPKERESFSLTIKYNGTILDSETRMQVAEAYELPPHGRCIDVDTLTISTAVPLDGKPYQYVHIDNIKTAPTIIEAEEKDK